MSKPTDIRVVESALYFIPCRMRVPLKFGRETIRQVTCARVRLTVTSREGGTAVGWGETPLSATWAWASTLSCAYRCQVMERFCRDLARAWASFEPMGHAMEVGHAFIGERLPDLLDDLNAETADGGEPMPHLAALICASAFDIALHDAYGNLVQRPVYETFSTEFMNRDLSGYLEPADGSRLSFDGLYPSDFFAADPPVALPAWHLVGGVDPLEESQLTGDEPDDGYPVTLAGWLQRDPLPALKIKLRGNDGPWDEARIRQVAALAQAHDVSWLSADFNCTVTDPAYVNEILDRLKREDPRVYGMLLYVEQPFPYDLDAHPIDVHSVASRKPLLLDESAHDWTFVRRGRRLGWNGVALKTCKTQTGALLSLCWARAHGMSLMVQDLTNPALAMIPHVLLARHTGTIFGVETNAVQFYPEASEPEIQVHGGLFDRRGGMADTSSLGAAGFGYRLGQIDRSLPEPAERCP